MADGWISGLLRRFSGAHYLGQQNKEVDGWGEGEGREDGRWLKKFKLAV